MLVIIYLLTGFLIAINTRNVKWATRVQVFITASKLIALVLVVGIGMVYFGKGGLSVTFDRLLYYLPLFY